MLYGTENCDTLLYSTALCTLFKYVKHLYSTALCILVKYSSTELHCEMYYFTLHCSTALQGDSCRKGNTQYAGTLICLNCDVYHFGALKKT